MNWRTTWMLLTVAAVLFAFIYLVERRQGRDNDTRPGASMALLGIRPESVLNLQIRRTNQLVLRVDQTNGGWQMTVPVNYPAQAFAITGLIRALGRLEGGAYITTEELRSRQQSISHFGLDTPQATVTLQLAGSRVELMFGSRTPVGDKVYAQLLDEPGIHVVDGRVYDLVPARAEDWRDPQWVQLAGFPWDRMEVRTPSSGYALQADLTNQTFYLSKPTPARADREKVENLFRAIHSGRVLEFVQDNPRTELELYGLQPPRAELVFGMGTNDLAGIQFGGAATNRTEGVYARLMTTSNVVVVSQALLDTILTTHADLREKRLLTFARDQVELVEVSGDVQWTLRRGPGAGWRVVEAGETAADSGLTEMFFDLIGRLEGEVERDVVTDFTAFGLAAPTRQYVFKAGWTNAAGQATNRVLAQLDIGDVKADKVYVRRADESSIYSMARLAYDQLPDAAWQMRDRRVWSFTTNEIRRVSVRMPERTGELIRTGPAQWTLGEGTQGVINGLAVEETLHRLGQLEAEFWVTRDDPDPGRFGFTEPGRGITVAVRRGTNTVEYAVAFGGTTPAQFPYAMVEVDGKPTVFEFPKKLHFELVRDLMLPLMK